MIALVGQRPLGIGDHTPDQPTVPADDGWIHPVQDTPPPASPEPSHRLRNLVVVVGAVVVVAALVCLCTIPVTASFSFTMNSSTTWSPPAGSDVHGMFTTTDGGTVLFKIWATNGDMVYSAESNNGSFSFTASNPPYTLDAFSFVTPHTVAISGHYTSPILVL